MRKFFTPKTLLFTVLSFLTVVQSYAQVNMATSGSYVQNFNTLSNSATPVQWVSNSTIPNWFSQATGGGAINYVVGTGSSATGSLYSFGDQASTDRALGSVGSGTAGHFAHGVLLRNTSGTPINSIKVNYSLEQWRNGGSGTAQSVSFYYKISSSFFGDLQPNNNVGWTPVPALNLSSALNTGSAGATNGNTLKTTAVENILIPGLVLNNGQYIMLKWDDPDHASSDHGLALDDVGIVWTTAPPLSANADLSNISMLNGLGANVPTTTAFTPAQNIYYAFVSHDITHLYLSYATADNSTVAIYIDGQLYESPSYPVRVPLNHGLNRVSLWVTAEDGTTYKIYSVWITRDIPPTPTIITVSPLEPFGNVCTNTTAVNSFAVNIHNLPQSPVTVSLEPLPGFAYSLSPSGPFTNTLSYNYSLGGTVPLTIYVQFAPTAAQSYSGSVLMVSYNPVFGIPINLSGTGVSTPATVVTGSPVVTGTSAVLNGAISAIGCGPISSYGFEYSTTQGFANGSGTVVTADNLTTGNFSKNVSGLTPGATYYYKAFATNSGGTAYGSQNSFSTSHVVPVVMSAQPLFRYTENFSSIGSWSNNFTAGTGANHFSSVPQAAIGTIPVATNVTTATLTFTTGSSGGVQKGSGNIVLLSTGTTDNNSSVAIDFYMDFTGMNAGTLSFDWATINNDFQSGNSRKGSFRVYATVDNTNFIELTAAAVLNFTNGVPAIGLVNNIALPAIFNNSATARLRFYYHNGTGGSGGSRPKISIDNLTVTGVVSTPCVTPASGATSLTFGAAQETSISAAFTAASPAVNEYLVVMSSSNSLTSNPVDGQVYNVGDDLGDGDVIAKGSATSFTVTGLTGASTYYFFIFPLNSVCTGGPLYSVANVLTGNTTTAAGLPPCAAPVNQPSGFVAGNTTTNSIQVSFTAGTAQEYLVLQSTSASFSGTLINGQVYNAGNVIGNATVVQRSSNTSFTASGLLPATQYYYFIFSLNAQGCLNGPAYNTLAPLTGSQTTQPLPVCATPTAQPASLALNASNTIITGTFNGVANSNYHYLVIRSSTSTLSATPVDNTDYAIGDNFGGGIVVANSASTSFSAAGLTPTTQYYFFVFAMDKNCTGGTKYRAASPLTGNATTTSTPPNNYYFGTLHAHSDYSDGQKDNPGHTPANAYAYADASLNMDFLGIAEHNHFSSLNNPGNELAKYHAGITQANTYSTSNPGFVALYGMEWGVISGGGHVLVYGNQMNELFGWESNVNGNVGPNYDVYVPKNTYTGPDGLFKTVNDRVNKNTFATLAHPDGDDFNNLYNLPYDAQADSAISGIAVESGPANSTNTTYSNPGSSMSILWYYQKLLSKGYHLGPTIDHDNHNTTFGRTTQSRTVVLAPELSQASLVKAVYDMHFYATQDYDTKVDFTVNTRIMGSIFEARNAPTISVNITDATNDYSNAIIRVMFGVPGSNVLPVQVDSVIGSSLSFVHNDLPANSTGYYYIDITRGTTRTVTSPVWYTRKCELSTSLNITACASYTWQGTTYTSSVVDSRTFTTTGGCDSVVTLNLIIDPGPVTNINTGEKFCTIQAGINDPQTLNGHTLEVQSGTYNEQVLVNKSVTLKGVGATQPVINFTGTVTGKKTIIDVSKADVTIDNFSIKVDLVKLSSGIIASGTNINNLIVINNKIEAYGSSSTVSSGSYSDRNAVSVNYSGTTNFRVASGGVPNVVFTGNTVDGVANDGFGVSRYFRSGISADEASGNFSNNTLRSINHDVLTRFGNSAAINITNNIFNGGGVEMSDMNAGAGALTVSGNSFNSSFANVAAANAAVLRLRNNYNARTTIVTNNTFTDHEWAVSLENYNSVRVNDNSFTPLTGSVGYHHITVSTKSISTNSASIVQKPIDAIIRGNTFNGSGTTGGTALKFMNHDNDAAAFTAFVVGGPGFENSFNNGIKTFIALDHQSGPTGGSTFPLYPLVIGIGANAVTTMAPWTTAIFAASNKFDVGSGLELPSAMTDANLFALEDRIQHKIDANTLGFVTVKAGHDYVTTNSYLSPVSAAASIQRGVDAASNGFTVNVGPGVFTDNVTINKSVTVTGQGQAVTKIVPAVSNPNCGGSGGGSICAAGGNSNVFLVQANNVTITQLSVDGDNPSLTSGTVAGGVDVDARNGIITDHTTGVYNNLNVNNVTLKNIFLRGIYASSGGTFSFTNNTVENVQGNTSSIGMFNFGGSGVFMNNTVSNTNDAIASNWSKGSTYTGNIVTNSASGIHTDNNGGQGGVADLIQNNQVSNSKVNGYGIWVFAPYLAVTVRDNLVTNVDVGLASAGQQSTVTTLFSGNTVDGQNKANSTGVYVTTSLFGFGSANTSSLFQFNYIRNNADGFYLESEAGYNMVIEADNNSITGNTNSQVTQAITGGSVAANMECNWWGTNSSAAIAAGIVNGAGVDYNPRLTNGIDVAPGIPGFQPQPSCANPVANAAVVSVTNVDCYGAATGSATISFTNGVPAFSYSVDGGSTVSIGGSPFTIHGLTAGTHTVVISDGGGNTTSVDFTVAQPAAPITVNYSFTPILCYNGLSTESITIYGGTAPYTVTNQGGGALVIGLPEGVTYGGGSTYAANYVYTVTDAKGCQYVFNVHIPQPSPLVVTASATPIFCNSNSSIVTVSATGGTAPYIGTGVFNATAGTFTYTVTDANGCTASATVTPEVVADVINPTITAPANVSVNTDAGLCSASGVVLGTPTVSDNCSIAGTSHNAPSVFPVGTTTVTWTVTDNSGNTATATQTVTVVDIEKPTINAPGAFAVPNDAGQCGATISNLGTPAIGDNCGTPSVSNDHPSPFFPIGTTIVVWTATDIHGNTDTSKQVVVVMDNEMPVISSLSPVTVSNDPGACGANITLAIPSVSDNCPGVSVTNDHPATFFPVGITYVTWTATDAAGWKKKVIQTVTVVDNTLPVITTPVPNQSLCSNGSTYNIPVLGVTDNCNVTVTYSITGATSRSGTGVNASGTFNTGISNIAWTVTDASGNKVYSATTVTVTVLSAPTITVSTPDAFCNKITLTAVSANSAATYNWKSGSSPFASTQQISLGLSNSDGVYSVTASAGGCTSTPASYTFQKQNLVSSYTILTYKNVTIGKYNKVATGSVGVMTSKGKAAFNSYSAVNGPGSFVKAPKIEKNGSNISISSQIAGVASVTLPAMQYNTASTKYLPNYNAYSQNVTLTANYNNLTVKKGVSITVTGNTYGTVKLEEGASIRFTNTVLNIDNLIAEKGAKDDHYSYIRFAPGTSVRISSKVSFGSQVWVNPDNTKLTFYMGDNKSDEEKFTIYGGDTKVTANIYMPDGKLKVTATDSDDDYDACDHRAHSYWSCRHKNHQHNNCDHRGHNSNDCGDDVYMTGVFIVEELESKGNTVIWNSYDCGSLPSPIVNSKTTNSQKLTEETVSTTEEELKITVMPNPSTSYFTLRFASKYETPLNLRVMDAGGRVVDARSNIGANSTLQIGHAYSSGTYYAEVMQNGRRKVVQLIKGK